MRTRARSRAIRPSRCSTPGVFDDGRYWDVEVRYAKAAPDRDPRPHHRHQPRPGGRHAASAADAVVPQHLVLGRRRRRGRASPRCAAPGEAQWAVRAEHADAGHLLPLRRHAAQPLFTENESNAERLWGAANATPYVKDAFHRHVIDGEARAP
ncbi:MAG: hypothetical protein MZW92_68290 [Comamonadaceae bacterium]|nr:hypothetical protein [Comamonadaceae bacterium]